MQRLNAKDDKNTMLNVALSFPATLIACAMITASISIDEKSPESTNAFLMRMINAADSGGCGRQKGENRRDEKVPRTWPQKNPYSIACATMACNLESSEPSNSAAAL